MSPGLVSYEFEPVNCTVAKSYYNGSVPCHVTNIMHRGCTSQMNCLEIIVQTSPNYGECKFYTVIWKVHGPQTETFPARTVSFQLDHILYRESQSGTVYFPRPFTLLFRTVNFNFLIRKEFTFFQMTTIDFGRMSTVLLRMFWVAVIIQKSAHAMRLS